MAIRWFSPAELDPLAAAAAPITPDPSVRPRRAERVMRPEEIEAHVNATVGAAKNRDEAHAVLVAQMMEQGIPRQEAILVAARDMARAHFDAGRGKPTQPHPFEQAYDAAVGAPQYAGAPPGPRLQMPEENPYATPEEIRAAGYQSMSEPGPTSIDGTPVRRPEQFATMDDARDYSTRVPLTDAERKARRDGATHRMSPKDEAMAARGFMPVNTPDGRVSYMVGYEDAEGDPRFQPSVIPGAPGRVGARGDLEQTDPSKPGFFIDEAQGPAGRAYVYRQNEAAQNAQSDYMRERQLYRQARAAGMTPAQLRAADPSWAAVGSDPNRPGGATRDLVEARRANDARAREARWRAQMMLAGRNPGKNMVNAFGMMGDPGLTEDQRSSLRYMMPGGERAAGVDAAHNQQLTNLGLRVAQGLATGQGMNNMPPAVADAAAAKARAAARAADPAAAGREDIAGTNYSSPEAQAEFERLAEEHDSGDE
jgi:hypothetical protein